MESPEVSDAEAKHYESIGLTEDGVCRKTYVPDQVKAESESRRVSFTISTGALDRDNDTIKVDGWDVKNYLRNPVVLFAHRSDLPPIAKAVSVVKTAGALKATAEFLPAGIYPLADQVYEMLSLGFLRATSVGFRPKRDKNGRPSMAWNDERGGIDFEEQELLEFSVVPVPSNPEALMAQAKDFAAAGQARIADFRKALDLAESAVATAPAPAAPPPAIELMLDGRRVGEVAEKAGRRLSAKTEQSLRSAHKSATEAVTHLQEAIGDAEDEMDDDKTAEPERKAAPAPEPPREPKYQPYPAEEIEAAVKRVVQLAIGRAQGRLD